MIDKESVTKGIPQRPHHTAHPRLLVDTFFIGVGDLNRAKDKVVVAAADFLLHGESNPTGIEGHTEAVIVNDSDGELIFIAKVLQSIHDQFFDQLTRSGTADVKTIVDGRRRDVLSNVSLVFSGLIPLGMPPDAFELWRLALIFGAQCRDTVTAETTHVISIRHDTDKVMQAVEHGIPVVKPDWLIGCFKQWALLPIQPFLLGDLPPRGSDSMQRLRTTGPTIVKGREGDLADGLEPIISPDPDFDIPSGSTASPPSGEDSSSASISEFGSESSSLGAYLEAEMDRELDRVSELGEQSDSGPGSKHLTLLHPDGNREALPTIEMPPGKRARLELPTASREVAPTDDDDGDDCHSSINSLEP